jgi:hypothetical protein
VEGSSDNSAESGLVVTVRAREFVGRPVQPGGSQSVFIRCDDDEVYNVKFKENQQSSRGVEVLTNELVAGLLGRLIDLPTPQVSLVQITRAFLDVPANEWLKTVHSRPVSEGLHFGSHRLRGVENKAVEGHLAKCANRKAFPCFFAFDIWMDNTDRKMEHCLVVRPDFDPTAYYVSSIDHGHCFGGPGSLNNLPARVAHWCQSHVPGMARLIEGESPFDEVLTKLARVSADQIEKTLSAVPPEWDLSPENRAIYSDFIQKQATQVEKVLESHRHLFPGWKGGAA